MMSILCILILFTDFIQITHNEVIFKIHDLNNMSYENNLTDPEEYEFQIEKMKLKAVTTHKVDGKVLAQPFWF